MYEREREREREMNFKKGKKTTNIDLTFFFWVLNMPQIRIFCHKEAMLW